MFRTILAINNRNGYNALRHLIESKEISLTGILVHPENKRLFFEEISQIAKTESIPIIVWERKKLIEIEQQLKESGAKVLLSVNFGYLIPQVMLDIFPYSLNLHTGFLPWNKGSHPNVWPFIDDSPAGVTLHIMTAELDSGRVISRKLVPLLPEDNAKTLYVKLEGASLELLKESFIPFLKGEIEPFTPEEVGSYHTHQDFLKLFEIKMDQVYSGKAWVGLLKALTFPPYKNAFFYENGKKYHVSIEISDYMENSENSTIIPPYFAIGRKRPERKGR